MYKSEQQKAQDCGVALFLILLISLPTLAAIHSYIYGTPTVHSMVSGALGSLLLFFNWAAGKEGSMKAWQARSISLFLCMLIAHQLYFHFLTR